MSSDRPLGRTIKTHKKRPGLPDLPAKSSRRMPRRFPATSGFAPWHALAGIFMLVGGAMSLRFRLIGLVCLVLLISLALGAAIAYSNASRSVCIEMRAALLVGRQTVENTLEQLQSARNPLRDLDDLVAS